MIDNGFYLMDLSHINSFNNLIATICSTFDKGDLNEKRISLVLSDIDLNQTQIQGINALINSNGSILTEINTKSDKTREAASSCAIVVNVSESNIVDSEKKLEEIFGDDDSYSNTYGFNESDLEILNMPTKYVKQTLRSGQCINFDGNLVIIGDCNPGCEVKASGDITVWGKLFGLCHAGIMGNEKARIRALNLNPIQIRIAGLYSRRPDSANIKLDDKRNVLNIEEALIENDEIKIFKFN